MDHRVRNAVQDPANDEAGPSGSGDEAGPSGAGDEFNRASSLECAIDIEQQEDEAGPSGAGDEFNRAPSLECAIDIEQQEDRASGARQGANRGNGARQGRNRRNKAKQSENQEARARQSVNQGNETEKFANQGDGTERGANEGNVANPGANQGDETEQGANQGDETEQGANQGNGSNTGANHGNGSNPGANQGDETERGGNQGDETERGVNQGIGSERGANEGNRANPDANQGDETEQGSNQGNEANPGANQGNETERGANQGNETERGANQGNETERGVNQGNGANSGANQGEEAEGPQRPLTLNLYHNAVPHPLTLQHSVASVFSPIHRTRSVHHIINMGPPRSRSTDDVQGHRCGFSTHVTIGNEAEQPLNQPITRLITSRSLDFEPIIPSIPVLIPEHWPRALTPFCLVFCGPVPAKIEGKPIFDEVDRLRYFRDCNFQWPELYSVADGLLLCGRSLIPAAYPQRSPIAEIIDMRGRSHSGDFEGTLRERLRESRARRQHLETQRCYRYTMLGLAAFLVILFSCFNYHDRRDPANYPE